MEMTDSQVFEILLDIHQKLPTIQEKVNQIYEQQQKLCQLPEEIVDIKRRILVLEQKETDKQAIVLSTKGIVLAACLAFGSSLALFWLGKTLN